MSEAQWAPDILGDGFEALTFDLGPDDSPLTNVDQHTPADHLAATLVRALPRPRSWWQRFTGLRRELEDVDVLYVHGWSDYFFQKDLANFWTDRGASFYALDLRRYGRSLREGQAPGFISRLEEYDEEIGRALEVIRPGVATSPGHTRRLVLLGHSTGGLVLSLWAARHPGVADALILNSPWLEFQFASRGRQLISPLVRLGARHNPLDSTPLLDSGFYARAQSLVGPKHELERVNSLWRPKQVGQVQNGWLRAILDGHEQVHRGLEIQAPICVLVSARSVLPIRWSEALTRADTVLDVQEVAKAALRLGDSISIEWIDGALHDVFLSSPEPRTVAYSRLARWVRAWSAATSPRAG